MDWLLEPFTFGFMQRGLAAGVLAGIACAVLSAFVVWRRMAFVGDAMAHTILPGVVIAFLRGANLFVGALIAAIITALGIGWFSRDREVREDTAIGVMFSGFFALGILLLSRVSSYRDLTHILFGDIRSEEHTSELQSRENLVCRLLLEKKKKKKTKSMSPIK